MKIILIQAFPDMTKTSDRYFYGVGVGYTGIKHHSLYGFALAPRLSNLHMLKMGLTISPLEQSKVFKRMTVGVDYYQFLKNRTSGAISDLDAVADSKDIGREVDLRVNWRINPRLSAGLEWGYFFPGHAYAASANDTERFLSVHLTHTF